MAKEGKKTDLQLLPFDEVDPYGAVIGKLVSKPVERFPLELIRPDPEQPRRLLPIDLAEAVNQGKIKPFAAMQEWQKRAESDNDVYMSQEMRELQRLATSIEQYGLVNPITIRALETEENAFVVVTGERRYWAHVLLLAEEREIHEGEKVQKPNEIKASIIPSGVVIRAHQIVENLMREDINVVEKAHGLWALRYELSNDAYRRHSGSSKNKQKKLVPWKQIEDSLDISRQYRLRIIAVLDLSEEAQRLIEQNNLAEATIRPIVERLKEHPDLQLRALEQLVAWQDEETRGESGGRRIVPSVRALVDSIAAKLEKPAQKSEKPKDAFKQQRELDFNKLQQRVRGTLQYMQKMDARSMEELTRVLENNPDMEIVDQLQDLRNQIDKILTALSDKR